MAEAAAEAVGEVVEEREVAEAMPEAVARAVAQAVAEGVSWRRKETGQLEHPGRLAATPSALPHLVDAVRDDVGVLAVGHVTLPVEEPGRDLELGRVLHDGDDALELVGVELSGAGGGGARRGEGVCSASWLGWAVGGG